MSSTWIMSFEKLMTEVEVKALRSTLEDASIIAKAKGQQGPVRDRCIVELALGTGLRVSEICQLKVSDIDLSHGGNSLIVRKGKNSKQRVVKFNSKLKRLIIEYLDYRSKPSDYLFVSERQLFMSSNAIQKVFKKWAHRSSLPSRYSIHSCRHFHASALLKASKNLRLVQQQLGHSSPQTTTVYAQVLDEEINEAVEKLE